MGGENASPFMLHFVHFPLPFSPPKGIFIYEKDNFRYSLALNAIAMENSLRLSVQLTEKDLRDFLFYKLYHRPGVIIFLLFLVLIMGVILAMGTGTEAIQWTPGGIPFLVLVIVFVVVIPVAIIRSGRKTIHQDPAFAGPSHYHFSPENIYIQGPNYTATLNWDQIKRAKETKSWFLLYLNRFTAHIFPKDQLTQAEIRQFRTFLRAVPNLKAKLKSP